MASDFREPPEHPAPELHRALLERIPVVTGTSLDEWFRRLEAGPALDREPELAEWLTGEYEIPDNYAEALVTEHELRRRYRATGQAPPDPAPGS
jgi:Domain of unknown function (DUF4287)